MKPTIKYLFINYCFLATAFSGYCDRTLHANDLQITTTIVNVNMNTAMAGKLIKLFYMHFYIFIFLIAFNHAQ